MNQFGQGTLEKSEIYFSSPSVKAKNMYYCVLCAGHFFCDDKYHLKRESYDSILILHVVNGTFKFLNHKNEFVTAKKNDTVILDCYNPHEYLTENSLESVWIHIVGVNTRELCNEIIKDGSNIVRGKHPEKIQQRLFDIMEGIGPDKNLDEIAVSLEVYKLLLDLSDPLRGDGSQITCEDNTQIIREYILNHINEKLTVKKLADVLHMSSTHFSRVFKKKTGFSPYDYVIITRLNRAKELLLKTDMSVVEIAYETGFNSEANFVYCFTNNEGISPGKFRKMGF